MNHLLHGTPHPSEIEEIAYCPLCGHMTDVEEFSPVGYKYNSTHAFVFRCPECEELFDLDDLENDQENQELFKN